MVERLKQFVCLECLGEGLCAAAGKPLDAVGENYRWMQPLGQGPCLGRDAHLGVISFTVFEIKRQIMGRRSESIAGEALARKRT